MKDDLRPACWAWEQPLDTGRGLPIEVLRSWQAGRCAICGRVPGRLVRDHCHDTGMIRGLLCYGCNTAERGAGLCVVRYRHRHPCSILGLEIRYRGYTKGTLAEGRKSQRKPPDPVRLARQQAKAALWGQWHLRSRRLDPALWAYLKPPQATPEPRPATPAAVADQLDLFGGAS